MKAKTWAIYSNPGSIKSVNEDAYLFRRIESESQLIIFAAVADGVGGHGNGYYASQNIIVALSNQWLKLQKRLEHDQVNIRHWFEILCQTVNEVNQELFEKSERENEISASTLTMCLMDREFCLYAHVGDSRLYILNTNICQVTTDHIIYGESILTKCVGGHHRIDLERGEINTKSNMYLLMTDGCYKLLSPSSMEQLINLTPQQVVGKIERQLKGTYKRDNLTVVAFCK